MQSASVEPALGTILLIDDDLELSDTMSEFLKIHGYATLQAQNGQKRHRSSKDNGDRSLTHRPRYVDACARWAGLPQTTS